MDISDQCRPGVGYTYGAQTWIWYIHGITWDNQRYPIISLAFLEALVYTRDIPSICQNTKTYQQGQFQMDLKPQKLPARCRHAHSFRILSWNSASLPLLFLPSSCSTSLSKHLTHWKIQSIFLKPRILWKRWFAWAFRKQFFFCYVIFTWIWTYKTNDLTDYQLIVGSFLALSWPNGVVSLNNWIWCLDLLHAAAQQAASNYALIRSTDSACVWNKRRLNCIGYWWS